MLFNFVGPSYEAANPLQDAQRLVNWYTEFDDTAAAKNVIALLGCPGLKKLDNTLTGEWRGFWVMPGNLLAYGVCGNQACSIAYNPNGTLTVISLGTLLTNTGPVAIRDNGIGGVVVIVDGAYGYVYTALTMTFNRIIDPAFLGADKVCFIDGWLLFNKPSTQVFYTSPLYWDGVKAFDGSFYALKDTNTDNIVSMLETNRELWILGERSTEIWYDGGGQNFAFQRQGGTVLQMGCAAKHSVVRMGQGLIWLGRSERGESTIVMTQGYSYVPISTFPISYAIGRYTRTDDAFAYYYSEDGHEFYVITFPTADATWCYDLTTKQWHSRASQDPNGTTLHRHRSSAYMNLSNNRIVGDYQNGKLYKLTRQVFDEDGTPLPAIRRTPHVWDGSDRKRTIGWQLQIEFIPGVGLQGKAVPQVMLRISNDGGFTWSNERTTDIGAIGQTKRRAIWRQLGASRDRVYEVKITDPVVRDIVGASLEMEGTVA